MYKNNMDNINKNRNIFAASTWLEATIEEQLQAQDREEEKIVDQLNIALEISEREAIIDEIENAELK